MTPTAPSCGCRRSRWDGWCLGGLLHSILLGVTSHHFGTPIMTAATTTNPHQSDRARRRAAKREAEFRRQAEAAAKLESLPVTNRHACGIDVGDRTHWVCVEATPDGPDCVREFPAHTPGLRQLVGWLKLCAVTTIALEATGVYGRSEERRV